MNDRIWFGGDYNPEQWPEEVWAEDVTLMQRAGVTVATVGVFSWAKLEPREGEFDFAWLDRVIDTLHAGGIGVDLATATASPPPWLSHRYPEVLPVTEDGVRLSAGSRQHYSPSSPVYRKFATRLVRAMAERYANHPALVAWHVNNEYGCHVNRCYSDASADAFRAWLRAKYGTIAALNHAWGTAFWSQQYGEFEEVYPPRAAPTFRNPTQLLDFDRFSSHALLECYRAEVSILRELSPGVPITTNFMGFFKPVDYWSWAPEVDFVSDDTYPDPADPASPAYAAMVRDLMRSLRHGQPWVLMEQATSAVNWRRRNAAKGPGVNRALSYQSLARGADGILYFQWRQAIAGAEKFHSALVPHAGADSRIYREVEGLGAELAGLSDVRGTRSTARVAIVVEWDSWWALEQEAMPTELSYLAIVFAWYRSLYRSTVAVDFVRATDDMSSYAVVIAPALVVAGADAQSNLAAFAAAGGTLVVGYQSAILDENLHVATDGYLGLLASTLGVRIEEFSPLAGPDLAATGLAPAPGTAIESELLGARHAENWAEFLHVSTAEPVATFSDGLTAGWPAITRNASGSGTAWYVATQLLDDGIDALLAVVLRDSGVSGVVANAPAGVEAAKRGDLVFVINHGDEEASVPLAGDVVMSDGRHDEDTVTLPPRGVAIVRVPADG